MERLDSERGEFDGLDEGLEYGLDDGQEASGAEEVLTPPEAPSTGTALVYPHEADEAATYLVRPTKAEEATLQRAGNENRAAEADEVPAADGDEVVMEYETGADERGPGQGASRDDAVEAEEASGEELVAPPPDSGAVSEDEALEAATELNELPEGGAAEEVAVAGEVAKLSAEMDEAPETEVTEIFGEAVGEQPGQGGAEATQTAARAPRVRRRDALPVKADEEVDEEVLPVGDTPETPDVAERPDALQEFEVRPTSQAEPEERAGQQDEALRPSQDSVEVENSPGMEVGAEALLMEGSVPIIGGGAPDASTKSPEQLQEEVNDYLLAAREALWEGQEVSIPTATGERMRYVKGSNSWQTNTTIQEYKTVLFSDVYRDQALDNWPFSDEHAPVPRTDQSQVVAGGVEGAFAAGKVVLDVGSGEAVALHELAQEFPETTFIGTDKGYEEAREVDLEKPGVQLTKADWNTLEGVPSESVDTIITRNGPLVWGQSPQEFTQAISRVAKPGAILRFEKRETFDVTARDPVARSHIIVALLRRQGWDLTDCNGTVIGVKKESKRAA